MGLFKKLGKNLGNAYRPSKWGDPLNRKGKKAARAANEARYQQALALFDRGEPAIGQAFGRQRDAIGEAQGFVQQGSAAIASMGQRSRQSARDIGAATTGQQSAMLQQRGLGSSTRLAGLARGVAADTQRSVQGVNEGVAGLQAQQMNRMASLQTLLGSSYVNQNQALNQWRLSKINTIASRKDVAGPGWLTTAAQVAGGIGSMLGGLK